MTPPLLLIAFIATFLASSSAFSPAKSYFLNCGSSISAEVDDRTFSSDAGDLGLFKSSLVGSAAVSNVNHPAQLSDVYASARVFRSTCWYAFDVPPNSTVFLRLHFFPFAVKGFDLLSSSLQLSASGTFLLRQFSVENLTTPTVKEYLLWSIHDRVNLTFQPSPNASAAFVNAIELFTGPTNFTNATAAIAVGAGSTDWGRQAAETVYRVNAGGSDIPPARDTLWRWWVSDQPFLFLPAAAIANSTNATIRFVGSLTGELSTPDVAPAEVYSTLQQMNRERTPVPNFNITWVLPVESGYRYVVRLHFCDIVSAGDLAFDVFVNSKTGYAGLRPSLVTGASSLVPFFLDFTTEVFTSNSIRISVGSSESAANPAARDAILNGFEVLKLNNSVGSLDGDENPFSTENSGSGQKKSTNLAIIVAPVAAAAVIFVMFLVYFLAFRGSPRIGGTPDSIGSTSPPPRTTTPTPPADRGPSVSFPQTPPQRVPLPSKAPRPVDRGLRIRLEKLLQATNRFDEAWVIGSGGFGKVYRGMLNDGTVVAVKRASPTSMQGYPEFKNEIMVLSQIRHRNLVSLLGYCHEAGEMILVYEYMSRGTLKELLQENVSVLSWRRRLEACIGAARGLDYLHTGFGSSSIIHRDVKSSNILLGDDFQAKLSDFGLSRLGPSIGESHVSTLVKGSVGYLDPEYFGKQQLTEKSDLYSFGVVLFETLSGRKVIDQTLPAEEINLANWASRMVRRGRVEEIVDPRLWGSVVSARSVEMFVKVARRCVANRGQDRPSIGEVLWSLEYALRVQEEDAAATAAGEDDSATRLLVDDHAETNVVFSNFQTHEGR